MGIVLEWSERRGFAVGRVWAVAIALGVAAATPVAAEQPSANPQAPPAVENLNSALDDLTKTPSDPEALLRAGRASLNLGDTQAALGFFRRAEQAAPANGEAKAGEALAMLRLHQPVDAVKLFAAAQAAGAPMAKYAGDRGLALDLVGQNVAAQRYYRQALAQSDDPEIVRRLALSEAISGDQRASEATLLPLLQQRDLSAYRTRAFALAILGKGEEAVSVAEKLLPADLSGRMAPYLRYMPRLTRAQQAAAANLGEFPPASQIGHDDPQIAALSAENPAPRIAEREPDSRLVPSGEPLGRSEQAKEDRRSKRAEKATRAKRDKSTKKGSFTVTYAPLPQADSAATSVAQPPQKVGASAQELPPAVPAEEQPAAVKQPESAPVVVARLDQPSSSAPPEAFVEPTARPSLSVSPPASRGLKRPASLADVFADFTKDAPAGRAEPGAVDITKIKPSREAPKPAARPKPPADPSRYWVQVGTGRNLRALAFTWRRLEKKAGALLARRDAYTARWGETRRLVTGPYKTEDEVRDAIKALKKKGINSFEFTSAEGEEVAPLK